MAVSDTQSGVNKIIWYYKLSTDSTYKNATDTYTATTANTTRTHTFTGLTQNKTYNAYAVVYDATGRTAQSTTINVITGTVPTASGATYTPNTWTSGKVTVTLPTKSGYTTVYTTNGKTPTKDSTKYSEAFTVGNNCTIYYLFTDGINIGGAGTVNIGNIDKTAPTINSVTENSNTSTASTATISTSDNGRIVSYGISTSATTQPTNWIATNKVDLTNVPVKVENGATWARVFYHNNVEGSVLFANEAEALSTNSRYKFSVLNNLENYRNSSGTFEFMLQYPNDTTQYNRWIQKDNPAKVTVANGTGNETASGYKAVHVDWTGNYWGGLTRSTATSACLINGSVGHGNWFYAIGAYSRYDKGIPSYSATATATELWARIDNLSTEGKISLNVTLGNITTNGTYYAWVKDAAGNVTSKQFTISKVDKTAPTISNLTSSNTNWTSGNITLTATASDTESGLYTASPYGWNSTTTWTNSNTLNVTKNGTYTVNVRNAIGSINSKSIVISNIDKTGPTINTALTGSGTTNSITLNTAISDAQSGVNKIIWYYKLSTDSTYKNATDTYTATTANTTRTHTFTGLTQNKTYNAYAVVYDATGRTAQSTTINVITGTVPTASGATYTPNTWTSGKVTVTLPTKSGYTTVYTTNGTAPTKSSTKYTGAFAVSSNCKINYLYTDGTNIGGAGTVNVTNIDTTNISISSFTASPSSTQASVATLSATVNDANSGLSTIVWQWGTTTNYGSSSTSTYITKNGSTAGTTGNVTKTFSLTGLSGSTTYYVKMTAYDVAGNANTSTTSFTTEKAVAQVGSVYYTSINNAESSIASNGTITMVSDNTEEASITEGKTIELKLNEKNQTGHIENNGNLTISGNGKMENSGDTQVILNNGNLTLNGGRYYGTAQTCATIRNSKGKLTINNNNVSVEATVGAVITSYTGTEMEILGGNIQQIFRSNSAVVTYGTKIKITDGKFDAMEGVVVGEKTSVTMTGGSIYASNGEGISLYTNSTLNMSGGTILVEGEDKNTPNGVWVSNGASASISGGTISTNCFEHEAIDCDPGGSVTITGGKFYNRAGGRAAIVGDRSGSVAKFSVNGGKFYTNNDSKKCPYSSGTDWRYYSTILVWKYSNKAYSWNSNTSYVRNDIGKYTYWNYDANQLSSNAIGTP